VLPLGGYGAPHVVLPACTLACGMAGYYARLLHTNLRGVLGEDYVRTARAKGLGPLAVHAKHALRNALLPLVTVLGLDLAGLLSGVVLTETVFNWPGLGRLAVEAVFNQDMPMVMGTVLFGAVLVVAINLLVDVLYVAIDPRIRREGA
jgi:peptide/nickel transport system permease protein